MRSKPDPVFQQAILIIVVILAAASLIGFFFFGGGRGILIGFGSGAILAVLLSIVALKRGAVGGDARLPPGVFVECLCGHCGGRSIKKLLPDTQVLPHNRPGQGRQCANPRSRKPVVRNPHGPSGMWEC